ncbi:hypothetical protein [Testudinid alphaherpesvirus 3]|uniref:Ig-like domain-containing protein n=1 Tax=Testudinid alphaherpesvirus 3 TaxID=2560801 RepID=A0A0K1R204_9ALPH|nr:hypothetical protein [Testudinid alphaherpesvirus 3]
MVNDNNSRERHGLCFNTFINNAQPSIATSFRFTRANNIFDIITHGIFEILSDPVDVFVGGAIIYEDMMVILIPVITILLGGYFGLGNAAIAPTYSAIFVYDHEMIILPCASRDEKRRDPFPYSVSVTLNKSPIYFFDSETDQQSYEYGNPMATDPSYIDGSYKISGVSADKIGSYNISISAANGEVLERCLFNLVYRLDSNPLVNRLVSRTYPFVNRHMIYSPVTNKRVSIPCSGLKSSPLVAGGLVMTDQLYPWDTTHTISNWTDGQVTFSPREGFTQYQDSPQYYELGGSTNQYNTSWHCFVDDGNVASLDGYQVLGQYPPVKMQERAHLGQLVKVQQNSWAQLPCYAQTVNNPDPTLVGVIWHRNGVLVNSTGEDSGLVVGESGKESLYSNRVNATASIAQTKPHHSGVYTCTVFYNDTQIYRRQLTLYVAEEIYTIQNDMYDKYIAYRKTIPTVTDESVIDSGWSTLLATEPVGEPIAVTTPPPPITPPEEVTPPITPPEEVTPPITPPEEVTPPITPPEEVTPPITPPEEVTPPITPPEEVTPPITPPEEVTPPITPPEEVTPPSPHQKRLPLRSPHRPVH